MEVNVVLFVLDTLSAIHLPELGYPRDTVPELREFLQKEGFVFFGNTFSTSCWTSPAHASIFTGLYPSQHGVNEVELKLGEEHYVMAEVLKEAGFDTIGISSNGLIIKELGFSRGFNHFIQLDRWEIFLRPESFKKFKKLQMEVGKWKFIPLWTWREKSLKEPFVFLTGAVTRFLKHKLGIGSTVVRNSKPFTEKAFSLAKKIYREREGFFLFVNIMETHHRYRPPSPYRGTWSNGKMGKWEKIPPRRHYTKGRFPQRVIEHLRDLYDEEILFTQHLLAEFLREAKRDEGKFSRTLWIITSDHGEAFGEGGHLEHMVSLEDSNLRVPLWVKLPGMSRVEMREDLVQLNDLYSLVLEATGSPFPVPKTSLNPFSGKREIALAEIPRLDYIVSLIKEPEDFSLAPRRIIRKEDL